MLRYLLIILAVCPLLAAAQQGPDSLWESLPLKFDWQVGKLYPDPLNGDLYITRFLGTVNGEDSTMVVWDGARASFLHTPFECFDIVRFRDKLVAVADGWNFVNLSAYDGQSWTTVDSFNTSAAPYLLFNLDSSLVVTGSFDTIGGHPIKQVAAWDGGNGWSDRYRMDTCAYGEVHINGVQRYKGEVYFGGLILASSSTRDIVRFDGKNWKDVGGGTRGNGLSVVNCMLVWNDELYVAGQFLEQDGSPGNCIAKWDGQRWHRLGGGITQFGYEASIYDMTVYHDNLYVVGVFGEAGGVRANNIAKWDGRRWCSLNTDMHGGTPAQIKVAKDEMYISGHLDTLNGKAVSHVARWAGGDYVHECGPVQGVDVDEISVPANETLLYPNPADGLLFAKRDDIRSLEIRDAAGKLVQTCTSAGLKKGIDISRWPAGFYVAKAGLENGTTLSTRFVKR